MALKILYSVLDWGLGHATRSTEVIRLLKNRGCKVVIASSGAALEFLRREFQGDEFRQLPDYGVSYPIRGSLLLRVFMQSPKVLRAVRQENRLVKEWCRKDRFDVVISDHRYGCHLKGVRSVFIGHQLTIPFRGWWRIPGRLINRMHQSMIGRFDEVWVPDEPDRKWSGDLSMSGLKNLRFIGPLSRFTSNPGSFKEKWLVTAVISGPEPQRAIFASAAEEELKSLNVPCLLVSGQPGVASEIKHGGLRVVAHLESDELREAMLSSRFVLSRSGYSSIMDYARLGVRVFFVPTPGQIEQEYLAERLQRSGIATFAPQNAFSMVNFLAEAESFSGFRTIGQNHLIEPALDDLLSIPSWTER